MDLCRPSTSASTASSRNTEEAVFAGDKANDQPVTSDSGAEPIAPPSEANGRREGPGKGSEPACFQLYEVNPRHMGGITPISPISVIGCKPCELVGPTFVSPTSTVVTLTTTSAMLSTGSTSSSSSQATAPPGFHSHGSAPYDLPDFGIDRRPPAPPHVDMTVAPPRPPDEVEYSPDHMLDHDRMEVMEDVKKLLRGDYIDDAIVPPNHWLDDVLEAYDMLPSISGTNPGPLPQRLSPGGMLLVDSEKQKPFLPNFSPLRCRKYPAFAPNPSTDRSAKLSRSDPAPSDDWDPIWDKGAEDREWSQRMEELKAYKQRYGTCYPVRDLAGDALCDWVNKQMDFYKKREVNEEVVAMPKSRYTELKLVGFSASDVIWELNFAALAAFKNKEGHTRVKPRFGPLGAWVKQQRDLRRRGPHRDSDTWILRETKLNSIGFEWAPAQFDKRVRELKSYRERNGASALTRDRAGNELYEWVQQQKGPFLERLAGNEAAMDQLKFSKLDQLDLATKEEIMSHNEGTGVGGRPRQPRRGSPSSASPPSSTPPPADPAPVAARTTSRSGTVHAGEAKSSAAASASATVSLSAYWDMKFSALCSFRKKHGHCEVSYRDDKALSSWIYRQKIKLREGWTSENTELRSQWEERKRKLLSIAFGSKPTTNGSNRKRDDAKIEIGKKGKVIEQSDPSAKWPKRAREAAKNEIVPEKTKGSGKKRQALKQSDSSQNGSRESHHDTKEETVPGRTQGNGEKRKVTEQSVLSDNSIRKKCKLNKLDSESNAKQIAVEKGWVNPSWEDRFADLKTFMIANNRCDVQPTENQELHSWIKDQRNLHQKRRKTCLAIEREKLLESIGFLWEPAPGRQIRNKKKP